MWIKYTFIDKIHDTTKGINSSVVKSDYYDYTVDCFNEVKISYCGHVTEGFFRVIKHWIFTRFRLDGALNSAIRFFLPTTEHFAGFRVENSDMLEQVVLAVSAEHVICAVPFSG